MTLSRKDFFRQSLFSLGETLLKAGEGVREAREALSSPLNPGEPAAEPLPAAQLVARADNRHCLAISGGCFSCEERCKAGAITLVMGEGLRVDAERCTGCGTCHDICPIVPKGVTLAARAGF